MANKKTAELHQKFFSRNVGQHSVILAVLKCRNIALSWMKKQLNVCSEWYDDGALVMNDEAVVLLGHLVGLNCIDANICMKGDNLDNQVGRDLSMMLLHFGAD